MTATSDFPAPQKPIAGRPRQSFAGMRTVIALMLREMATTYGRSPGGYIWAVVEPVAGIFLLSLIFSAFVRSPALGVSFPIYYATGMIPFISYMAISGKVAASLMFSKPLLAYPRVTYVDAIAARFLTNVLTEVMVTYIVFTALLLIYDDHTSINLPVVALAVLLASVLALGVGTLNCFLTTLFPAWQRAWSILMRPLMLVSCIFFLFETVPQPYRDWLWFNPLIHIVGLMRRGFYPGYDADYVSISYVLILAGVFTMVGLVFLRRYHRDLLEN